MSSIEWSKLDRNSYIQIGLFAIGVISMLTWAIVSGVDRSNQENDLIKREISGILVTVKDLQHGDYTIRIKQHNTGKEMEYYLQISRFIKENNIQVNDSISKEANSHTLNFYRKKDGIYEKYCDLYY
jgi:hypothetical protein